MCSLVPLLFRALLTFRFSGVGRTILRHESELAVLANDVGKIGCNAHSVREALIRRRASRDLHEGEGRGNAGTHALTTRPKREPSPSPPRLPYLGNGTSGGLLTQIKTRTEGMEGF
jgi:hypothetical protein